MFTQQTPFLMSALSPAVGSDTARQLAQAFGNCNQPLTHRAGVTLQRPGLTTSGGLVNGTGGNSYNYSDGGVGPTGAFLPGNDLATQISPWAVNPNNYYGGDTYNNSLNFAYRSGDTFLSTYPEAASNAFYNQEQSFNFGPVSTNINSPWFTRMGDINTFDFSSRLGDIVNSYAGPTFQVAGDSHFDNSIHTNQTVNNQTVNNQTVDESVVQHLTVRNITQLGGDPGPAGGVGPAGPAGNAGDPGAGAGLGPGGVFFGGGRSLPVFDRIALLAGVGAGPDILQTRAAFAKPAQCVKSLIDANLAAVNIPNDAIKDVTASLTGTSSELPTDAISGCSVSVPGSSVNIPTDAISGCSVTVPGVSVTIPTGVTFDPDTCTVSFSGTTTVFVLASSSVSATVSTTAASTSAVHVLGSSSVAATVTTTPAATATVYTLAAAEATVDVETVPADTDEYSVFGAGQAKAVVDGVLFTPPADQAMINAQLVGIQEQFARVVIGLV